MTSRAARGGQRRGLGARKDEAAVMQEEVGRGAFVFMLSVFFFLAKLMYE